MSASPAPHTFRERCEAAAAVHGSLLCVGLDPDPDRIPRGVAVRDFLAAIAEATADLVCCYKPNAAFFESRGPGGYEELRDLIASLRGAAPVLLDAKRGDVGHAAAHYARAAFGQLGAHAVTVSPWPGRDAVEPFLAWEDRHVFVLCRTSNAGAGDFQDLRAGEGGRPLWLEAAAAWSGLPHRGTSPVMSAALPPRARGADRRARHGGGRVRARGCLPV